MTKRLFISHSWQYSEPYLAMARLLRDRQYFNWTNYSVPVDKAFEGMSNTALKEQLRRQIRPVHCVIIIGGMWTNYSDWIQFEMEFAEIIEKPILGVRPRGAKIMPAAVTAKATKVVSWNSDSIVAGIREIT